MSWWAEYYRRPLKDPLLLEYTTEELAYEYFNQLERRKADEEAVQARSDKIEEEKQKSAEEWADEMEALEDTEQVKAVDPRQNPSNVEWMEEQIKKHKEEFGEDFGEDLSLTFED